jgi:site-specific DNA-cytosine methylase
VFLAWSQGLPPLKTAVHEEKILGGQDSGKQEARRAGPPRFAKKRVDGADGVGMPCQQRCRSEQSARHRLDPERESETALSIPLTGKKPVSAADVFCGVGGLTHGLLKEPANTERPNIAAVQNTIRTFAP